VSTREHQEAEPAVATAERAPVAQAADLAGTVLALQRRAGNAATQAWLARFESGETVELAAMDPAKKSALETKYGVTVTGPWSADDFADLEAGLGKLKAAEAKRINGWELKRVSKIGTDGTSGLTTMNGTNNNVQFADSAFDHGSTSGGVKATPLMVNGVKQGVHVVLHEVGHVVLYTNSTTTPEDTWKANVSKWITQDISTQPNGKKDRPYDELYPEAFACFHTGPDTLKADAPKAHAWFAAGSYMS
jgi:hypothetical protein